MYILVYIYLFIYIEKERVLYSMSTYCTIKPIQVFSLLGTFDELVEKNGHFAQLVKQLQEENEKEEEERRQEEETHAEGVAAGGDGVDEENFSQSAHVDFEAGVLGGSMYEEPRSRAQSESEVRRQSSARQKPVKPDASKAKLMTSEDAATGMLP